MSTEAKNFVKYCYMLPKDVLPEYVFDPRNHDVVDEITEIQGVESPEELIYHLYEGTWFEE